MSHYAKIENGIVTQVIVAEQDFIDTLPDKDLYVQTSYNTQGGIHKLGDTPLRKNFAGIGYIYDKERDAFIPPKPFPSWLLDEDTCTWNAPVAMPTSVLPFGQFYAWDEEAVNWKIISD